MTFDYKKTTYACFTGYIVQAIVNSFVPLLFAMLVLVGIYRYKALKSCDIKR